jgi:hypothetical protein
MARWRLKDKHYLAVPGTEWEYKETDSSSGRQGRKIFEVPLLLDPANPSDHNYPGEIVVANKPGNRDIVFRGPPTPDMEPLDEDAEKITAKFSKHWIHPIESLPGTYSESILSDLQRQMDGLAQKVGTPSTLSMHGVSQEDFARLQKQVQELMEKNAELQARDLEKPSRRI